MTDLGKEGKEKDHLSIHPPPLPPLFLSMPPCKQFPPPASFPSRIALEKLDDTSFFLLLDSPRRITPVSFLLSLLPPLSLVGSLSVTGNWLPAVGSLSSCLSSLLPLPPYSLSSCLSSLSLSSIPPSFLFLSLQLLRVPVADGKSGIMTRINYLHTSKRHSEGSVCVSCESEREYASESVCMCMCNAHVHFCVRQSVSTDCVCMSISKFTAKCHGSSSPLSIHTYTHI